LINLLLADLEEYRYAINAIKKDISYMPIKLKKNLSKKHYLWSKSKWH